MVRWTPVTGFRVEHRLVERTVAVVARQSCLLARSLACLLVRLLACALACLLARLLACALARLRACGIELNNEVLND